MQCTKCKYENSRVVKIRHDEEANTLRRRECRRCGHRFNTKENSTESKKLIDDRFPTKKSI